MPDTYHSQSTAPHNALQETAISATFTPRFDLAASILDCGKEPDVSDYDAAAAYATWPLIDYTTIEETQDQLQINAWLQAQDLTGKRVLHVGAGNSSLARLVGAQAAYICSVTVSPNEKAFADALLLPNYQTLLANKHGAVFSASQQGQQYDFIVDNNIASFVCCQRHLQRYLETLVHVLAADGVLITHWLGMQWTLDLGINDVERVWRLDEQKLCTIATAYSLQVTREGDLFFLRHA